MAQFTYHIAIQTANKEGLHLIAESIHNHLVGNKEYIDSKILLSEDCIDQNTIDLYFDEDCETRFGFQYQELPGLVILNQDENDEEPKGVILGIPSYKDLVITLTLEPAAEDVNDDPKYAEEASEELTEESETTEEETSEEVTPEEEAVEESKNAKAYLNFDDEAYFECLKEKYVQSAHDEDEIASYLKEFDRKVKNGNAFQKVLLNTMAATRQNNEEKTILDIDMLKENLAEMEKAENMSPEDIEDIDNLLAAIIFTLESECDSKIEEVAEESETTEEETSDVKNIE